jgi:hypothetical protein
MMSAATDQLQAQSERVTTRLEAELRGVAARTAQRMKGGAQARVRVRTRATQTAIVVVEEADKRQFRVEVQDVAGRNPMVPVWLEYGTSTLGAQPFMGPAADAERATYLAEGEAACARVFGEAG